MKYDVYLLNYNNYYNRQVKKLNTIAEYISSANGYFLNEAVQNINVAFGDGINTELIINQSYVNKQPDYVIIEERDHEAGVEGKFSRWFIIDSNLTRGGQYHFTIRRDICADFYDIMMNSTYLIERGYVNDSNDLIFNSEGQKYSQIKKSQTLLKDETYGPWIVGYLPRRINGDPAGADYNNTDRTVTSSVYGANGDITVNGISNWPYYQYVNNWIYNDDTSMPYMARFQVPVYNNVNGNKGYQMLFLGIDCKNKSATDDMWSNVTASISGVNPYVANSYSYTTGVRAVDITSFEYSTINNVWNLFIESQPNFANAVQIIDSYWLSGTINNMRNSTVGYNNMMSAWRTLKNVDNTLYYNIKNTLSGKTIKDTSSNKIYRIILTDEYDENGYEWTSGDTNYETLWDRIYQFIPSSISGAYGTSTLYGRSPRNYHDTIILRTNLNRVKITLEEVATCTTIVPKDDESGTMYRQHLVDAPYDMFCIPYTSELTIREGNDRINPSPDVGMAIATAFITELGAETVYDLQILPYCPVREYINPNLGGIIDITAATSVQVRPIQLLSTTVNYVFYCSRSTMENITLLNPHDSFHPYSIEITDYKKSYNVDTYRLCSPNFASMFEFSPAQNGGVDRFLMSATYKPFNPYIRVRPQFKRMFGDDYKDARGLILQGDFSLPKITSAWTEYELQNKNYQQIFNRDIQSLDLQQDVQQQQDWFSGIMGVIKGAIGGGIAGGLAGGGVGGLAGVGIGSLSSAVGGALDITNNQRLMEDTWTKSRDIFNYNLRNIQALPYSLTNVGSLTADNPQIPILEYYTASDDEVQAYERKIRYYGMAVNKIGLIAEFVNPNDETFIKGTLIRLLPPEGVVEEADNHFAQALTEEIEKGIYIGGN